MSALATIALQAGLPLIEKVLSRRLGDAGGQLATEVISAVAGRLRIAPETLEAEAEANPGRVIDALREVEREAPAMLGLHLKEVETQLAMMQLEAETQPGWVSAWRPLGMYLIGLLWLWNVIILHVCNAIWKIALPPMPFEQLIQLSGLYMGLYMGGHTLKDAIAKWAGKGGDH